MKWRTLLLAILAALILMIVAAVADAQPKNTLTWTDTATNETAVQVERKLGPVGSASPWALLITLPGTTLTQYVDLAVVEGVDYCYRVRYENVGGVSPYSNTACRTVPVTPPPVGPGNLTIQ